MSNEAQPGVAPQRVIAYVDGFNLYFALKEAGWQRFYWLNVHALCQRFLSGRQRLITTKYYTSRVIASEPKKARQAAYLNALQTVPEVQIRWGQYRMKPRVCQHCGAQDWVPGEKMTDVNIATDILMDAFDGAMEVALVVSEDSDLTAPLKAVRERFPAVVLVCLFPPGRRSANLANYAQGSMQIGRARLNQSQFPREVIQENGIVVQRPSDWA